MTEAGTRVERQRFGFRFEPSWRIPLRIWGVTPSNAYVEIDGDTLRGRFGVAGVEVPIEDIRDHTVTGPWGSVGAFGIRRSVRNADISFASTARGGVCLRFSRRPKVWIFHPPALTVTVDDIGGFSEALQARGIPLAVAP